MSDHFAHSFDSDADRTPLPRGTLTANGQWLFGSIYAGLALIGFSFGLWAGVGSSKPKAVETAELKKEPEQKPVVTPPVVVKPKEPKEKEPKEPVVEPKPKEPEPKPMEPEPKPKEPEPKPKEPEPKPKEPEPKKPEPKAPVKAVAFKEIKPILIAYCNNCHGAAGKPKGGVDLRTVAAIMKGGSAGDIVTPGMPEKSALYLSIKMNTMPPEGKGPSPAELQLIHDWIASGAKERRRTVRGRRGRGR